MKKVRRLVCFSFIMFFLLVAFSIPYDTLMLLSNNMVVTSSELVSLKNLDNPFIKCVSVVNASDNGKNEELLEYKLFNMFDILSLKVNVVEDDEYYVGGSTLGFSLKSKGVILVGGNFIITKDGIEKPFSNSSLQTGDIILAINGVDINGVGDISKVLDDSNGEELLLKVKRNGTMFDVSIKPALDVQSGEYKLGLWVKEDAMGVGTLTYINKTTGRFGALGHCINDMESNDILDVSSGEVYESRVLGVRPGGFGKAGELVGTFNKNNVIGSVDKNCNYGVFGYMLDADSITSGMQKIEIGGRLSVVPGRAKILSCIDGCKVEEFDIEIVKTNFQSSNEEKSMIIRVTDKDLINRTGGIVQGMSGSPIIQNGKLIGAVTHVFVNDATKGFGIYIDWMINQ
ncbi:MAG: SpoIVB peptidase [Clostridia bacterium]|nr:SpoIVB peptidase [Clostridia bacterium]